MENRLREMPPGWIAEMRMTPASRGFVTRSLADAKSEFARRVDAEPMPPLLAEDFEAPIDLPWPDYTWNGARGW